MALLWCLATGLARAQGAALPEGVQQLSRVEGITEYRLPNGLQVLLVPDDSKPTTTVNMTYRVGSRLENYGETGMAHLLEHMLFKGTPTTRDVWAEFNKRGMRPNGSTSYDRTNYFASFSANPETLRWYLFWQADAMVNSLIARADLDTEMTVVRNEFESGENSPARVLQQQVFAAMYQWHNYGKSTIGARSDIENVDIPRLQAFYRQYYQPDNATLTVSGRFDVAQVLAWVAQSFGPIARPTRVLPATYTLDPPQDGERQVTVRRVGGTPSVYAAYHVPAGSHPDFAAVQLLALVLGDTPGGRLHKRLVAPADRRPLAAQTFAYAWSLAEPSPLLLGAGLAPGQDVQRARAALVATVDGLRTQPVTAEELERARTAWLNDWEQGFTDPERVGVAMSEAIGRGDWRLFFVQRDQVRALTLADLQRVAATWLRPDNRTVGLYLPTAQPERAPQDTRVDVAALVAGYKGDAAAAQAESFEATPANLDARTQPGAPVVGIKVAYLPKSTRGRVVHATLRLRYGTGQSLFGQEVVAGFAAALLDKGGAGLTRQQIADRFDKLQASVDFGASGQVLQVSINTKREHLPAVVELVGRLLREPAYAPEPLEELRSQYLTGIEQQRKEPEAVAADRIARHGDPYPRGDLRHANSFDETAQDVRAVSVQKLRDFHRRFLSAARGEFAAVGDIDVAATQRALVTAFGTWQQPAAGAQRYERLPQPLVQVEPQRYLDRTPDKANASYAAQLALPLSDRHPDFAALSVANAIFGSAGNSRLWKRVREREGLSYDVRSSIGFASEDENSAFALSAIFAPQNQPRVEAAIKDELQRSLTEGFTQQELDEARNGLLNRRRLDRAQDAGVVGALANNLYLGRKFARLQQTDEAIAALTLEQVNAAWRRHIAPRRLVQAWAGDFKPVP
jgi:zinc protease